MVSSATNAGIARFGSYELDPESRELRRSGSKVRLQEQPARILGILVQKAGQLVTRDEVREALWPADTFVDFDHSLNTAIRKLRTALEDSADEPRYIETVARHGYRFIAPVDWVTARTQPVSGAKPQWSLRLWVSSALVTLAVVSGLAIRSRSPVTTPAPIRTIAVLAFENDDAETQYVSDGIAEALIRDLSASPTLRVTGPTSSFRYKTGRADVRTVGKELGVEAVVTGAFRVVDGSYLLRAELVEAAGGSQIWGGEYRQPTAQLPALQKNLLRDLSYRLGATEADASNTRRESPAYDLYLRGRHVWTGRTMEGHLRAIEFYERAIELDPGFALAYAGLGAAYGTMLGNNLVPGAEEETNRKSKAAIDTALSLDPMLAEAWASRAARKGARDHDFEGAERDYRHAIELNPSYAQGRQWYAFFLVSMGRMDEARREGELAYQIDPFLNPAVRCGIRIMERRYEEAIEVALQGHRAVSHPTPNPCIAWAQLLLGDFEAAIESTKEHERYWEGETRRSDQLRTALERGGPPAFWDVWIEQIAPNDHYQLAEAHALAGEIDAAFEELELAYAARDAALITMYVDPCLDNLRGDPRFDELARRIGLAVVS